VIAVDKFWELVRESVIVQSLVTLFLIVTLCLMFATSKPIPELLSYLTLLVVGFWFGSKSQQVISARKSK
jgi:hypothetical protein